MILGRVDDQMFVDVMFRTEEPADMHELRRVIQSEDLETEVLYADEYEIVIAIAIIPDYWK